MQPPDSSLCPYHRAKELRRIIGCNKSPSVSFRTAMGAVQPINKIHSFLMIFLLQWLLTSSFVPSVSHFSSPYHRSPPLVLLPLLVWRSNQLHLFVCSSLRSHAKRTRRYHMRNGFSHYEDRRRSINLSSKTANSDTNETLPCEKWF